MAPITTQHGQYYGTGQQATCPQSVGGEGKSTH